MFNETIKATGKLSIVQTDANGNVVDTRNIDNLVVTVGKGFIASRMKDATAAAMSHMAVGTDSTAAAAGQTALGAQLTRVALTSTTVSANTVTYVATFGSGTSGALTEAGLFNDPTAGTMLARTTYSVINKGTADTITITWAVTIS
jgi:hypothetical protein